MPSRVWSIVRCWMSSYFTSFWPFLVFAFELSQPGVIWVCWVTAGGVIVGVNIVCRIMVRWSFVNLLNTCEMSDPWSSYVSTHLCTQRMFKSTSDFSFKTEIFYLVTVVISFWICLFWSVKGLYWVSYSILTVQHDVVIIPQLPPIKTPSIHSYLIEHVALHFNSLNCT